MRKLRIQFGLFFLILAGAVGFLLSYSFQQIEREEYELWRGLSEKVYNHFQSEISEFLQFEDSRSFYQYRFYYIPSHQMGPQRVRYRSPLSQLPKDNSHGILGYFQIDPNNTFHTPYLPSVWQWSKLSDLHERRELHTHLYQLTHSLQEIDEGASSFIDLGRVLKPKSAQPRKKAKKSHEPPPPPAPVAKAPAPSESMGSGGYRNVYPNPIKEQKKRMEAHQRVTKKLFSLKAKMGAAKKDEKEANPRRQVAIAPQQLLAFEEQALADLEGSDDAAGTIMPTTPSVFVDPFQARLVADNTLIFYRKVWLNRNRYIQGFAVDLVRFYSGLMGDTFANSDLIRFSIARLNLDKTVMTQYGAFTSPDEPRFLLFERALGYPLDRFVWQIYAMSVPHLAGRLLLYVLSIILVLLSTVGLYFIYRSVAAQIQLSQKRSDFVSAVTHELKTPLTSIRMYSEMLEDGWAADKDKQQEYYQQINQESSRLSRLIENVLQLARLEKGTYKVDTKIASPNADFESIGKELTEIASHQGFTLNYSADPELAPIKFDAEGIKQILYILLDNSIKFGAKATDKSLEMKLTKTDGSIVWSWADRGPGIPSKDIKKVFDQFYRVENEMTRSTKGTGIGLAMARMITDAMGAKITAKNRDGGGLEVRMTFQET